MFSGRRERELENLISSQRAEISDLRAALRQERNDFAAERTALLDRIIALTQPAAHREIHPRPPRVEVQKAKAPRRIFFPGHERSFRPDPPSSPRTPDFEADVVTEAPPDGDAVTG